MIVEVGIVILVAGILVLVVFAAFGPHVDTILSTVSGSV
jgi:hypothetical protein